MYKIISVDNLQKICELFSNNWKHRMWNVLLMQAAKRTKCLALSNKPLLQVEITLAKTKVNKNSPCIQ